ncbi:hypothetical protein [Burkholderia gladioli]|uniref:hypothetical protein n=1 Tax=Burkholderia gladioli TaxID=28095 RepID=UPI00163FC781|nr:hypothetical protein [Burkholderia gladioli]
MSDFKAFYQGLPSADRKRFAEAAGTSTAYIEVHLIPRRKIPKPPLMGRLADACRVCGGHLTQEDLLAFFYRTEPTTPAAA